jgi:hypothetical protein
MREMAGRLLVAAMMQLVRVVAEHLPLAFDAIEHSDLLPCKLHHPNGTRIGLGTCTTDVPEQFDRKDGVAREYRRTVPRGVLA